MLMTDVIPSVAIQEIYSGNKFTGVAPNGTSSEEALFRGRLQKWIGGTLGGEFSAPAHIGMKVVDVFWDITSTVLSNVDIYLVDDDGVEYLLDAQNVNSGHYAQRGDILVPPTFKLRVKSDQDVDAVVAVAAESVTNITGDGVSADYDGSLAFGRVEPTTVSIVAGTVAFTDPAGDGVLVGAGAGGGSGTVNYVTGVISLTFNTPGDFAAGHPAATYDYNNIARVGIVIEGYGWGQTIFDHLPSLGKQSQVGQL